MQRRLDALIGIPLLKILSGLPSRPPASRDISSLLVIKLAAVGDTIVLIPALRALRRALPHARITWLVSNTNRAIAATVPYVDDLVVWNGAAASLPGMIAALRRRHFSAVIDFEQWARGSALLAFASGAPIRIGFDTPGQHRAGIFTATFKKTFEQHELDDFLSLAERLVPVEHDRTLELWETAAGQAELPRPLSFPGTQSEQFSVLIHPGCGADGIPREWPIPRYAVFAHWLMKNYGADIYVSGGPEETRKTRELTALLGNKATDLGGRLSWPGLLSLVKKMDLIVSGNTGVMHVAAAFRRPQVALHGPTNPAIWGPVNDLARVVSSDCPECPCLRLGFEYHRRDASCMERISIDAVKAAALSLLSLTAPSR